MTRSPLLLLPLLALAGCGTILNGIAPSSCYHATSGSISVVNSAGTVLFTKPAETLVFCPPALTVEGPTLAASAPAAPATK